MQVPLQQHLAWALYFQIMQLPSSLTACKTALRIVKRLLRRYVNTYVRWWYRKRITIIVCAGWIFFEDFSTQRNQKTKDQWSEGNIQIEVVPAFWRSRWNVVCSLWHEHESNPVISFKNTALTSFYSPPLQDSAYCVDNCSSYCQQEDRTDGLSGSVSSDGGEVGILGRNTVVKGDDKPPVISLPGLDFSSDKGRKLIGY